MTPSAFSIKRPPLSVARICFPLCLTAAGGALYYLIEVLFRGFSHWTMAICGGLCLTAIFYLSRALHRLPLILRALLATAVITAVELAAGYLLNIRLGMAIWDYSRHSHNLWGQISLYASTRWFLLCIPVCGVCRLLERLIFRKPHTVHDG